MSFLLFFPFLCLHLRACQCRAVTRDCNQPHKMEKKSCLKCVLKKVCEQYKVRQNTRPRGVWKLFAFGKSLLQFAQLQQHHQLRFSISIFHNVCNCKDYKKRQKCPRQVLRKNLHLIFKQKVSNFFLISQNYQQKVNKCIRKHGHVDHLSNIHPQPTPLSA